MSATMGDGTHIQRGGKNKGVEGVQRVRRQRGAPCIVRPWEELVIQLRIKET